jgi:hypothetical protein
MRLKGTRLAMAAGAMMAIGGATLAQGSPEAGPSGLSLAPGTTLNAVLNGSIDSKKVKVGDAVSAHTIEALNAGGKIIVPKGAKLVGRVTQATARGKGDPDSVVGIRFDKAVLKKGEEVGLNLWIRAIAAEPRVLFQGGPDPNAMAGPGTAAAAGSPMKTQPAPIPQAPANAPESGPEATEGTGAGLNAAGLFAPNSRGVYGLEGLKLSTDPAKTEQGSLITSSGKSVQLDGGTRLLLAAE